MQYGMTKLEQNIM